jgi:hypothetical protein
MALKLILQDSVTAFTDQTTVQPFLMHYIWLLSSSASHSLFIWLFMTLNKFVDTISALYSLIFDHLPKQKLIVYLEWMPNLEAVVSIRNEEQNVPGTSKDFSYRNNHSRVDSRSPLISKCNHTYRRNQNMQVEVNLYLQRNKNHLTKLVSCLLYRVLWNSVR